MLTIIGALLPCIMLCHAGHLEVVQLLVDAGSDPTLKNDKGETPFHYALYCHQYYRSAEREENAKRLMEALLAKGARLANIGSVTRQKVQWASSEPWYSDLILTDEDDGLQAPWYRSEAEDGGREIFRMKRYVTSPLTLIFDAYDSQRIV